MKKTSYTTPEIQISAYTPTAFIALSWSDEETDEALTPDRGNNNSDDWEDFWEGRE
jgi:hypothetical protein